MAIKRIAIVAGEMSGDILGSRLMLSLKQINPDLMFEGIGGPEMIKAGFNSFYDMERLSVMGITEVFKRLPELLSIRKSLIQRWSDDPPDLMIGIDAPDFNLKLEAKLHQRGIKVTHYVSPSVWAWRAKRVNKMRGNLDLMLTLFPFEETFYQQAGIPVAFVGHPLADEIPLNVDQQKAREGLGITPEASVLALLPGSRSSELKYLAEPFLLACKQLLDKHPHLRIITPLVNQKIRHHFQQIKNEVAADVPVTTVDQQSRECMIAADWILLASGTAAFEAMLVGRPMVAGGKMSQITANIIRWSKTLRIKYFTLPNNLTDKAWVEELIQEDVTVEKIVLAVERMIDMSKQDRSQMLDAFDQQHQRLRLNASDTAASILAEKFQLA